MLLNCCSGHAGHVPVERLVTSLQLGKSEMLRGSRNFLITDKPEHYGFDCLKEKGGDRHSARRSRERSVFSLIIADAVSMATLGWGWMREWEEGAAGEGGGGGGGGGGGVR